MGNVLKRLNGKWYFKVDPAGVGEKDKWFQKPVADREVKVPAVWQSYGSELVHYTGSAWYSKEFKLRERKKGQRLFIRFDAVDYLTDVWLNGNYLGSHEGGYTPFQFEISDFVRRGENLLVVRVYDPEDNSEIPHGKQGSWYTRVSGIWQDVSIIEYGRSFIDQVLITPEVDHQKAVVRVGIDAGHELKDPNLVFEVHSPLEGKIQDTYSFSLSKDTATLANDITTFDLSLSQLYLWELEEPHLYDLTIYLKEGEEVVDRYRTYFGMRKIEIKRGRLYLNNHPLYIRGALDQAFWPGTIYRAESEELIKKEIKQAKDLGFNLLRKHIKTEDSRCLYWADRIGMLIWEEPANYARWTPQARERFKREYTRMVERDYNHPSIIAWSIYNEEWGLEWRLRKSKEMQQWVEEFYDYAKRLDPTRPVCDNSGWAHVKTDINDYHRYYAVPENYREWQKDLDEGPVGRPATNFVDGYTGDRLPLIVSEFGIWGLPELSHLKEKYSQLPPWFAGETGVFTEEFKVPQTATKNFVKYGLDRIFTDFDELARLTQEREYRGVKYLIEEMRKREKINGYVVTELTDIEWEVNGFLTYFRKPKESFVNTKDFNGAISVILDYDKHNYWGGEEFTAVPIIINNTRNPITGILKWELEGTDLQGTLPVHEDSSIVNKNLAPLKFTLPEKEGQYNLNYVLLSQEQEQVLAKNREELTVTFQKKLHRRGKAISTYQLEDNFQMQLAVNGFNLLNDFGKVCLTSCLDDRVEKYLRQGGRAIFLAERGSEITRKGFLNFKKLVDGESWDRAASFNFMDRDFFPALPVQKISGWELQDLYASYVVSNLDDLNWSRIIAGNFYGWIGNPGATILELPYGEGTLLVVTLKLVTNYNKQPIGTGLLHYLIDYYLD
jgi:hypothetical protein